MLTERIDSPSILKPGTQFFAVEQFSYDDGNIDIVSIALERTKKDSEGYGSERIEVAINYEHPKQRESITAYYAYNLTNSHFFEAFKDRDDTMCQ